MEDFYLRPLVVRMQEIFEHPKPPSKVTEEQFDRFQEELDAMAQLAWHEISRDHFWYYLLDLAYVELQQDLFNYLFPALLIRWWEAEQKRAEYVEAEIDLHYAMLKGDVFETMMSEDRRTRVFEWMVDAYMDGIQSWSGRLDSQYDSDGPDFLHGPLCSFNALGQSVPILENIWKRLEVVESSGHAQWWLVLATGFIYEENKCPFVPAWTPDRGGGGIYLTMSNAHIDNSGYLLENQEFISNVLQPDLLVSQIHKAIPMLEKVVEQQWASELLEKISQNPEEFAANIEKFKRDICLPDLGGLGGSD